MYFRFLWMTSRFPIMGSMARDTQVECKLKVTSTHQGIGIDATGSTPGTRPRQYKFGQPGTKYLISPAKFVEFLLSHAKPPVNLLGAV